MSIPSRVEAAAIVRRHSMSPRLLTHSTAVAEVCAFICAALAARGVVVDARLAESAALLHDMDKALAPGDELRQLGHGRGGAEWLRRHGHAELCAAVAGHPVTVLGEALDYEGWAAEVGLEGRVVSYADKRATQEVVSLDERFERWYRRYPDSPLLAVAHERARRLEGEICVAAGLAPDDVGRLAWVDAALADVA